MKKLFRLTLSTAAFILCVNFGGPETSIGGGRKNKVNFYGILITQQNQTLDIDNISIGYMYKDIPVYDAPSASTPRNKFISKKENNNINKDDKKTEKYLLDEDPHKGIITKIDFAEISEIRVVNPNLLWLYTRKKGYHPVEYIEIEVISNDTKKTKSRYIIETSRKLICDQINEAGPIEKDVPLQAIKLLSINGYHFAEENKQEKKKTREKATPATAAAA